MDVSDFVNSLLSATGVFLGFSIAGFITVFLEIIKKSDKKTKFLNGILLFVVFIALALLTLYLVKEVGLLHLCFAKAIDEYPDPSVKETIINSWKLYMSILLTIKWSVRILTVAGIILGVSKFIEKNENETARMKNYNIKINEVFVFQEDAKNK